MDFRRLILDNFKWKLTALILATVVWFIIQLADRSALPSLAALGQVADERRIRVPVMLLSRPEMPLPARVDPATVDIRVRGEAGALKKLAEKDILAFVNLSEVENPDWPAVVRIHAPPDIVVIAVIPAAVDLEQKKVAETEQRN